MFNLYEYIDKLPVNVSQDVPQELRSTNPLY